MGSLVLNILIMNKLVLACVLAVATAAPLDDTPDVAAAKASFKAAFAAASAGDHAKLAPVNNDMQAPQIANSIVRHVAEILGFKTNEELEDLYRKTAWYFETKSKKQGTAYDYFKQSVADPSLLNDLGLDENMKAVLVENIQRKLTQQAVKIRADFECSCFTYEGIDAVKDALRAGIAVGNPEIPIKINLIAPPVYVMTCSTPERSEGLALLNEGCKVVEERIKSSGGNFAIHMAPKVVTATDDDEQVGMGGNKDVGSGDDDEDGEGSDDDGIEVK